VPAWWEGRHENNGVDPDLGRWRVLGGTTAPPSGRGKGRICVRHLIRRQWLDIQEQNVSTQLSDNEKD
jgi:hypothetical protein